MKKRSYHIYLIALVLMVMGVLLQGVLISGHIPFLHLSLRNRSLAVIAYQTEVAARDQYSTMAIRMRRPTFQTGMIFPQWGTDAYSTTDTNWLIGLKDIQDQTGAQWIEIPINLYQSSVTSTQVIASSITPTPGAVAAGIRAAHARYFRVFVVPLVTVGGILTWSGSIQFSTLQQTEAWFDSYWQALEPYAAAAAQAGAEQFAIGTEFEKLQLAPAALWDQLIQRLHQVFPGKLTYDINWSSLYSPLPSWLRNPGLNAIGVSVYIPLTDTPQRIDPNAMPSLWQENIGNLLDATAVQLGMPVFISEIGYRDTAYALYRPWERDARAQAEPQDPQEQAGAYNAALSNVIADPHITGIYFWAWSVPLFQPNWKPAARILFKWYTSPLA